MPAKDRIHDAVKNALIKDGWLITHDPFLIEYAEVSLLADLGAERPLAAERAGQKIVVEIKSFIGPSPIQELKVALGQYDIYSGFLELLDPERKVYIAISQKIYQEFFQLQAIQFLLRRYKTPLIVVNIPVEEVVAWIN